MRGKERRGGKERRLTQFNTTPADFLMYQLIKSIHLLTRHFDHKQKCTIAALTVMMSWQSLQELIKRITSKETEPSVANNKLGSVSCYCFDTKRQSLFLENS